MDKKKKILLLMSINLLICRMENGENKTQITELSESASIKFDKSMVPLYSVKN